MKSLEEVKKQLNKTKSADKYRLYGDLIMANMYNLKDYSSSVSVYDYENARDIVISTDDSKSLKDNANIFYKKYNKLKKASIIVEKMAEEQKNKYLGLYTILPSELSLQLAEVALDLGTTHDQVNLQSRKSSFPFFIVLALLCDSAGFSVMSSWKQS